MILITKPGRPCSPIEKLQLNSIVSFDFVVERTLRWYLAKNIVL